MSRPSEDEAVWEQRHELAKITAITTAAATLLGPTFFNVFDDPRERYIKAAVRIAKLLWDESSDCP